MSEFKPTRPGWYWDPNGQIYWVGQDDDGLFIEDGGECIAVSECLFVAPVVALEDGPGINAIQRQCLETALPTTTLEYCLLGLAGESGEVAAEGRKGWKDADAQDVPGEMLRALANFIHGSRSLEWWKKAIRAGEKPALPPLPEDCKPAIAKELLDVLWYALVGLDRCGVSASEAFAQLYAKLQARKAAGTLAATEKRMEEVQADTLPVSEAAQQIESRLEDMKCLAHRLGELDENQHCNAPGCPSADKS